MRVGLVQAVIPQDAVKIFIVAILPGLPGLDKLGLDAFFTQYFLNRLCDKFVKHIEEELKNQG